MKNTNKKATKAATEATKTAILQNNHNIVLDIQERLGLNLNLKQYLKLYKKIIK